MYKKLGYYLTYFIIEWTIILYFFLIIMDKKKVKEDYCSLCLVKASCIVTKIDSYRSAIHKPKLAL